MENNITVKHMLAAGLTFEQIGDAFGVSKQAISQSYQRTGDISNNLRGLYARKECPNKSKNARKLYLKVFKHLKEQPCVN